VSSMVLCVSSCALSVIDENRCVVIYTLLGIYLLIIVFIDNIQSAKKSSYVVFCWVWTTQTTNITLIYHKYYNIVSTFSMGTLNTNHTNSKCTLNINQIGSKSSNKAILDVTKCLIYIKIVCSIISDYRHWAYDKLKNVVH